MKQKVIIGTSRLVDYAGSEIAVLELIEHFSAINYNVFVATFEISKEFQDILEREDVCVLDLKNDQSFTSIEDVFDLAWIQHSVCAYRIMLDLSFAAKKVIFSSLSHFEPIEAPPISLIKVSKYIVNSEENLKHFQEKYPELGKNVSVFPNAAPNNFWLHSRFRAVSSRLQRLAIVSNHVPDEVSKAAKNLKKRGVVVDVFGLGGRKERVTPELLSQYCGVLTIGKTVQYCIALKIPVYCYDHFGGVGWLNVGVFDNSRYHNFSGRNSRGKVGVDTLVDEIVDGYAVALSQVEMLYEKGLKYFKFDQNINTLISELDSFPNLVKSDLNVSDINILLLQSDLFLRQREIINNTNYVVSSLRIKLHELEFDALNLVSAKEKLGKELEACKSTIEEMNKQIEETKSIAEELGRDNINLNYAINKLNIELMESGSVIQQMNDELTVSLSAIHKVSLELTESKLALQNANIDLIESKLIIENLDVELAEARLKTEQIDRALEESKKTIDGLDSQLVQSRKIVDKLNQKIVEIERGFVYRNVAKMDHMLKIKKKLLTAKVGLSWIAFLIKRSISVIRHQGWLVFFGRVHRYLSAALRRISANKTLSRASLAYESNDEMLNTVIVSFVIPVYDRTDVLREAIKSALNQTIKNIEVIIVADGSPSDTLDVIGEFKSDERVKIFNFPISSGNAVRGRNKGIRESKGKYVAFLDSDDVASPNRLELTLPLLESGRADVVYGAWQAIVDGSRSNIDIADGQLVLSPDADFEMLREVSVPCQSTVIVRKELLNKVGYLKPTMEYREDHELWVRLAYRGAVFKSIDQVLTRLRLHEGNNELNFIDKDNYWLTKVHSEYEKLGPLPKKIAFILPGVGISGGIAVVFKHAQMLMAAGHDAFVINVGDVGSGDWYTDNPVPIVHISDPRSYLFDSIDLLFATGWSTVEWLDKFHSIRKLYFVQSDERRFFDELPLKEKIHATYLTECEYVTEAYWIQKLLHCEFGHKAMYVPNGIDLVRFNPGSPLEARSPKRMRVLLEGPIVIPFKGMVDSYNAVKDLDCEIWIVSSAGKPPADWRYDRFFEAVSFGEMSKIYSSCDVFLKMSRIEGFFGPPMEAMACGCSVVVGKVTGYDEYIIDNKNALVVEEGDVDGAKNSVSKLINDAHLRQRLIEGGYETVKQWSWDRSAKAMLDVVELS